MEARIMVLVEESCMLSARTTAEDETNSNKREQELTQVGILTHQAINLHFSFIIRKRRLFCLQCDAFNVFQKRTYQLCEL